MTEPRPPEGKHSQLPWKEPNWVNNYLLQSADGEFILRCPRKAANAKLIVLAVNLHAKLVAALDTVVNWFDLMDKDQHEELVEGQTLESACANWDKLLQPGLDIAPLKALLREAAK